MWAFYNGIKVVIPSLFLNAVAISNISFAIQTMLFVAPQIVTISGEVSLIAGETALLSCVSYGETVGATTWSRAGVPVVNSSRITTFEETVVSSGLTFKRSFLRLCTVEEADVGLYSCTAANNLTSASSTVSLQVSGRYYTCPLQHCSDY